MIKSLVYFSLFISLLTSCLHSTEHQNAVVTEKIDGVYTFKYPSGEIEVLYLHEDSTFKRMLYKNETHYRRKHNPYFLNEGTWRSNDKAILFNEWMEYCYLMYPDSMLREPTIKESQYAELYPKTSFGNAVIIIWLDSNYILKKED